MPLSKAAFLVVLIIANFVLTFLSGSAESGSSQMDAARVYSASRDAIVVILNERNDTMDDIQEENEQRKAIQYYGLAAYDFKRVTPLVNYFSTNEDGRLLVWSSGAGFFVRKDGIVITSYHVVRNSKNLYVVLFNGEVFPAKILDYDARPDYDIAVLKVNSDILFPILPLATDQNSAVPGIATPLVLIGHPYSYLYTLSTATISKLKLDDPPRFIQIQSSILPGNSGSPLLNESASVVGVVYASLMNSDSQGFATPISMVQEVLDRVLIKIK